MKRHSQAAGIETCLSEVLGSQEAARVINVWQSLSSSNCYNLIEKVLDVECDFQLKAILVSRRWTILNARCLFTASPYHESEQ